MPYISLEAPKRRGGPLHIELVPKSTWGKNVRSMLPKEQWDILRKWVYAAADYLCEICGGEGKKWPVECHERWQWEESTGIQKLVGFVALCPKCHGVKNS